MGKIHLQRMYRAQKQPERELYDLKSKLLKIIMDISTCKLTN